MSRHGYSDDLDNWALIRWRGRVASAIRGRRGQKLLKEMLAALDAMPVKELIPEALEHDGQYCALGTVGQARGINMSELDPEDYEDLANVFDISSVLVREIEFINDEWYPRDDPERDAKRWQRVRQWVAEQIKDAP